MKSTHDTVLRLLPPLIAERKHVDLACATLDTLFTEAAQEATTRTGELALAGAPVR